jgi:hypothetical protein
MVNSVKMRFIDALCPPALLYLLYVVIHTGLDLSLGMFATAAIKAVMGVAGVVILDSLCSVDLGIVSWAIVATPFIMVALASSISLGLGMDRMTYQPIKDKFSNPLSGDNLKNRDRIVTHLKNDNASPVSTSSLY